MLNLLARLVLFVVREQRASDLEQLLRITGGKGKEALFKYLPIRWIRVLPG